jgi:hypothetical protein
MYNGKSSVPEPLPQNLLDPQHRTTQDWIVTTSTGQEVFNSQWFKATDLARAAAYFEAEHTDRNLYFNVGLRGNGEKGKSKRGGYDRIAGIPGLWDV